MPWKTPARSVLIPWALLAFVIFALILWLRFAPPGAYWSPQQLIGMRMPEPKKITLIEKVVVQGPERVRVVPKEKIVEIYRDLPTPSTVGNENAVVTAVCDIPVSPAGGTAVSVLLTGPDNVATGYIEYKAKPLPFFALQRAIGIRGGGGTGGKILGEAYVQPVRLGTAFIELRAFAERDDRSGADFGGVALVDVRF